MAKYRLGVGESITNDELRETETEQMAMDVKNMADLEMDRFTKLCDHDTRYQAALIQFVDDMAGKTAIEISIRNVPVEYLFHIISSIVLNISESNPDMTQSMIMNEVYAKVNDSFDRKENHES